VKKGGMRQGKERTNGAEVQEEECEGKERKHDRRKRIRFARWTGKEKEFSIGKLRKRKRWLNLWGDWTSKEKYLWEVLERTEEGKKQ
jgi:hypothetical protein